MASTPAYRVEDILPGGWVLQLTSSIDDVRGDWADFSRVRERCREHLGVDLFREDDGWDYLAKRPAVIRTLGDRGLVAPPTGFLQL